MAMAVKLARLTHKIAIQLHLVAESCIVCNSRSWRPVRTLLATPSRCVTVKLFKTFSRLHYTFK